jgi:carboxylesterase
MSEETFIKNPHLEGDDFFWPGSAAGILLIHGFTATTAEVRLIAEKLHGAGYTTAAPLITGHGTHPDELNQTSWQDWLEKVEEMYLGLKAKHDPVFVVAESMGTLLAILLAARHPEIAGLMLFAPAIKIQGLWRSRFLAPFMKYIKKTGKDDGLAWKGYNVYPVRGSLTLLKLQKEARRQLSKIHMPTLVFTGEHDHTIDPDSAKMILDGISSDQKGHIHLEHSAHCILLDRELDQVSGMVLDFIQDQSASS